MHWPSVSLDFFAEVIAMPMRWTRRAFLLEAGLASLAASCGGVGTTGRASPEPRVTSPQPAPDSSAQKLVRDVVDFKLRGPFAWNGGSVTMKLHATFFGGERAYFVRTDTSDADFAKSEGLVFVPLLANALTAKERSVADIFVFERGASGQLPVVGSVPGERDFTPLYRLHRVTFVGAPVLLDSAAKIRSAEQDAKVKVEVTKIVVNYPIVKWPKGELGVDTAVESALAGGPLLSKPDTEKMLVTFKLHQCYPESRYIITDTSAVPMAPMMSIVGSPATTALADARATSKITVFGNGLKGPGVMGFQPGIFEQKAGDVLWSPMWDHWTAVWKDPGKAVLLKTQAELDARVRSSEIVLHRGTPDTKGQGFVVNCPTPVVAPNDFVVTR